ncbi:MAG: DUF4417 domain-containing protein [Candidatus Accumulibacter sp.]|uniref:DUF4417 domain-containing protein n=1 Tax=Candidatus Accumulibacter affinis TaxID=2954384 RepID=A0A935TBZ2_9PROT|nr:DUF4417 domain-containing protein [Candidatus Accumulibacter affinis]
MDDYRQEFYWRKPNEGLMVALVASVCTAPDFTVWSDDPVEWKRFQAWRSAMVAGLWAAWGVRVLPVVSFESGAYEYVAAGSTWAVRSPGKGPDVVRQWVKSLSAFARDSDMGRLVLFGRELVGLDQELGVPVLVRGLRKRPDAVLLRAA